MRLFIAVDVPAEIKDKLQVLIQNLRPLARIQWSPVANLHLTTKFIGEWPESRIDDVKRALAAVATDGPVDVVVRDLGWFPNARNPRVLWAGVEPNPRLTALARATEQA